MALFIDHDTTLSDSIKTTYHRIAEFSFNVFTGKVLVTVFSFITKADADSGKAPYSQANYQLTTIDPVQYAQLYPVLQSVLENGILADVPEFNGASLTDPSILPEPEAVVEESPHMLTPEEQAAAAELAALVAEQEAAAAAQAAAEAAAAQQAAIDAELAAVQAAEAAALEAAAQAAAAAAQAAAEEAALQAGLQALNNLVEEEESQNP